MNIGDIRALEDEQDPERRKALLARVLTAYKGNARDIWEALSGDQRKVISCTRSIPMFLEDHWGYVASMAQEVADEGVCPKCNGCHDDGDTEGEMTLTFMRIATVEVESHGHVGDCADVCETGPILVSCAMCNADWIIREEKK